MYTAQKMKFSIKDFFCTCDQIRRKLRIWSHLLKKSLMENFIFIYSGGNFIIFSVETMIIWYRSYTRKDNYMNDGILLADS